MTTKKPENTKQGREETASRGQQDTERSGNYVKISFIRNYCELKCIQFILLLVRFYSVCNLFFLVSLKRVCLFNFILVILCASCVHIFVYIALYLVSYWYSITWNCFNSSCRALHVLFADCSLCDFCVSFL